MLHSLLRLSDELSARERAYDEAIGELQTTLTDLQSQHEELLRTRELAQQLSTPVIRLAPGVLMMPLVGQLDRDRANLVLERLLEATKAERARHVILDITGIGHVDAGALGYFERVARALRLIGAVTILAGVRPQVARDLALQEGGEQPLRAVSHVQEAIALSMASKVRVPSGASATAGDRLRVRSQIAARPYFATNSGRRFCRSDRLARSTSTRPGSGSGRRWGCR